MSLQTYGAQRLRILTKIDFVTRLIGVADIRAFLMFSSYSSGLHKCFMAFVFDYVAVFLFGYLLFVFVSCLRFISASAVSFLRRRMMHGVLVVRSLSAPNGVWFIFVLLPCVDLGVVLERCLHDLKCNFG